MRKAYLLALSLLCACAPQQTNYDLLVIPADSSYFETMIAPFYRQLADLGLRVDSAETFYYSGAQSSVPGQLRRALYDDNEGFCPLRREIYRAENRPHVLVLAADGSDQVRGLVYDLSRRPRVTYAYFEARSLTALPTRGC